MSPRDWTDMASVYAAGGDALRGYHMNIQAQVQADAFDAMAARCAVLAERHNMTPEQLEEALYAERNAVCTTRQRCPRLVHTETKGFSLATRCVLHRDHVQDGTDHVDRDGDRMPSTPGEVPPHAR